jgi:hypothetical protein
VTTADCGGGTPPLLAGRFFGLLLSNEFFASVHCKGDGGLATAEDEEAETQSEGQERQGTRFCNRRCPGCSVQADIVKHALGADAAEHDGQISSGQGDACQVIEGYVHKGAERNSGIGAGYGVQESVAREQLYDVGRCQVINYRVEAVTDGYGQGIEGVGGKGRGQDLGNRASIAKDNRSAIRNGTERSGTWLPRAAYAGFAPSRNRAVIPSAKGRATVDGRKASLKRGVVDGDTRCES